MQRDVLIENISKLKWFHQIDLGGVVTPGVKPMANAAYQASVALRDIEG
jgi:hypothetical protein